MNKWCEHCMDYGHRKWLFLGTHKTHRLYLRFKMWQELRRLERG